MSAPARFRELLQSRRLLVLPGVYDGLSARIAEQAGFPALYISGGAMSRSTGIPDLGLLSVDAVVAGVLYDFKFPAALGKAVFIIGRVAGLSAHVLEEMERERPMRFEFPFEYDGPVLP